MKIGCALLAAGAGKRFGSGKLLHEVDGESMIARALRLYRSVPFEARVCVTRAEAVEIRAQASEYDYIVAINPDPDRGVGTSVSIATQTLVQRKPDLDGILYAVSDQPYLTKQTIENLLSGFEQNSDRIVSLAYNGVRGNPAVFPKVYFAELSNLTEDIGGGAVIKKHIDCLKLVEVYSARELEDIDTIKQE